MHLQKKNEEKEALKEENEVDLNYGTWKIDHKIGSGSYGTMYEITRQDEWGKTYHAALKIIRIPQREEEIDSFLATGMEKESISEYYESIVKEIISEVEMMYDLNGATNIVYYQDHVVRKLEDGVSWEILIRMELLTSLTNYLKAGNSLDRQDVIRLGIDICSALERCNKKKIIHRDIKPENILISGEGDFKLGDFGIARTIEGTSGELSTKGSYNYMAPEVFKGQEYGYSIDIYSLGIVMYKLLNNNRYAFFPPHPERIHFSDEKNALRRRMNGEAFPFPCNDSTRLGEIVLKACSYDPKDRYSSPAEMRRDLQECLDDSSEGKTDICLDYKVMGNVKDEGTMDNDMPEEAKWQDEEGTIGNLEKTIDFVEDVDVKKDEIVRAALNPSAKSADEDETVDKHKGISKKGRKNKNPKAWIIGIAVALCLIAGCAFFVINSRMNVKMVSCGGTYTAILKENGSLWMTGSNGFGQLGDGTTKLKTTPVQTMTDVKSVSCGSAHTAILKDDGSLWMTGRNEWSQLGDGTEDDKSMPVQIMSGVKAVACGYAHTAILKEDGNLWMTGLNYDGQLGDGTKKKKTTPVQIMSGVRSVSCGSAHTAILKDDGSLWMTGKNSNGQLGDGTTRQKSTPVQIMTDVKSVSCGSAHTAILKEDGSLWMAGKNSNGQLGDGYTRQKSTPVQIMTDVKYVSCGSAYTAILKKDGSLWMTGYNGNGQFGDGTGESKTSPVQIMTDVKSVSCGSVYTAILKEDGSLWMTGNNTFGQLGDGTNDSTFEPIKIME